MRRWNLGRVAGFRDGDWELYVMNADGSDVRRLTTSTAAEANPAWSRDGGTILFTTTTAAGATWLAMSVACGPHKTPNGAGPVGRQ